MLHRFFLPLVLSMILPVAICRSDVQNMPNLNLSNSPSKPYAGFLSSVSPDYKVNKNILSLTKIPTEKRKQAFTFVVLMNQTKKEQKVSRHKSHERTKVHLLWTGSKKLVKEQKVIKDQYPVDVSIANFEDGYASDEWNVVLPSKKPREVAISFLWSF